MQVPSLKSVSEFEDVDELLDPLLLGGICGTN
jgi:hypothetical protein